MHSSEDNEAVLAMDLNVDEVQRSKSFISSNVDEDLLESRKRSRSDFYIVTFNFGILIL